MDINIILRRGLIYSLVVTLITIGYFALIFLIERLFQGFIGYKSLPWAISVVALFVIVFNPLKNKIQNFIDKYFFKGTLQTIVEENQRLMEELSRQDRFKAMATFASNLAHEIRNPLTAIKTFSEYLPEKIHDEEFIRNYSRVTAAEIEKINNLTNQLLDFSRPVSLNLKPTSIHNLLDETLTLLQNDLTKHNIKLIKEFSQDNIIVSVDCQQLKQAFLNLFLNAKEAMAKGGTLTIATSLNQSNPNSVIVRITDTGEGISKDILSHIFEPFFTTKEKGSGLGLSIVYSIIQNHKGKISVESEYEKGTTFTIKLPVAR